MNNEQSAQQFLETFVPLISSKFKQLNKALWILETTGSQDAGDLKAELETELRILYSDRSTYEKLLKWAEDKNLEPLLKRQLNVLIRTFKQNLFPKELIKEIANKETQLAIAYSNFRSSLDGKTQSENDIREILKKENDPARRQRAWQASKEIGNILAPQILNLIELRNRAARSLGYSNYFLMQLDLQEVDEGWLFHLLEDLHKKSEVGYVKAINEIEQHQCERFGVTSEKLGPWAWAEPFGQDDPMELPEFDALVANIDICKTALTFYKKMDIDIQPVFQRSDMYERQGKNQHAFCIDMDREGDIRTLNNVRPTLKWLGTVLHEFGHAIYDLGYDRNLPWLLREPPHMLTTEAMALLAGRQTDNSKELWHLINPSENQPSFFKKMAESQRRHQLIFSRWALVMTYFERELYKDPHQNLNVLWWNLVHKYQKIRIPNQREGKKDWAAKYHMGLAPVYYYSYLLGELLASALENALLKETKSAEFATPEAARFFQQKLFSPGNSMNWMELIKYTLGHELNAEDWIQQFTGYTA